MNCPRCHSQMKPLFTGSFCPNDCDRPAHDVECGGSADFVTMFSRLLRKLSPEDRHTVARFVGEWRDVLVAWDRSKHVRVGKKLSSAESHGAEWIVRVAVDRQIVSVVKNRFAGFSLDDIPDFTPG